MTSVAPFLVFYIGAALVAVTRGPVRFAVLLAVPLVGGLNILSLAEGTVVPYSLFDYSLVLVRADGLSMLFGYLFHVAALIAIIYSLHIVKDTTQQVAGLLYAGSALGAVFAGDLITLFLFWEMLAITSAFLIMARRTESAQRSAVRYLVYNVLSGVILLAGLLIRYRETGSLEFSFIGLDGGLFDSNLSSLLIFIAFGIKCAFPVLHTWVTDSYPEATPTGTVFLSAFTTKVAVYALARAFPGTEALVYIGATMAMFPIFYAVIENDLRRVLAYSMINQIGFMVVGVGLGTALALNGAVSHAFNDVVFKGLLFMSMGAVLHMTGKINGSELGGLYKSMPITTVLCIVGAASISAFPLFSGFVSKSMVMVAALEEGHPVVWLALLFASAGVFHHAGIKIPYFAFFAHDSGIRVKEPPINMLIAMSIAAAICIFNGSYPAVLYSLLPFPVDYVPYTASHILSQTQLLFFSALAFCLLNLYGIYPPELPSVNVDAEWFHRRLLPMSVQGFLGMFGPLDRGVRARSVGAVRSFIAVVFAQAGPGGALARTNNARTMVVWVLVLLAFYMVFYFS